MPECDESGWLPLGVRRVTLPVVPRVGNRLDGNGVHMGTRCRHGRRGNCDAGRNCPCRAECYDSLNNDGPSDAHDSSMASTEVSSPLHGSGGTHGTSEQFGPIAGRRQFRTPRVIHRIQFFQILKTAFKL
jgi:hypothetical protein